MTRAFIIGNGPSLTTETLDLLKGEVCWAVNRIHLMFDKTEWRPTHYVRAESPYATRKIVYDDLSAIFKLPVVAWLNRGFEAVWRDTFRLQNPNLRVEFMPNSCEHTLLHYDDQDAPHEWHEPLCMFGSSLHVAIQLAAKEGYSPLYLVGCDLGYRDGQPSHFDENYESDYKVDGEPSHLKPADYANGDCLWAHNVAFRSSPTLIYNATMGGSLEVYPRVDIGELIKGEPCQSLESKKITTQTEKDILSESGLSSPAKRTRQRKSKSTAST